MQAIAEFFQALAHARHALQQQQVQVAQVYWMFHGYRLAPLPTECWGNHVERMMCLQHMVLQLLQAIPNTGIIPLDLGTMAMDGPNHWFVDAVHLAAGSKIQRKWSGVQLMAIQVLLNAVCNT